MKVVMGIDPGSRFTGYAVIGVGESNFQAIDCGVVSLSDKWSLPIKLMNLEQSLSLVLDKYQPVEVALESIFLGKNADSAFKLGHVRGVCMMIAAKHKADLHEYAARKVKKVVTGSGAASKEQVQLIVSQILGGYVFDKLDTSDAAALALCHSLSQNTLAKFRQMEESL